MATLAIEAARRRPSLEADAFERVLAGAAAVILAAAVTALVRGRGEWAQVPPIIWLHIATVLVALALTPVILLRRRGDRRHRLLGRIWSVAMIGTALLSLGVTASRPGHWSWIHLLSAYVLLQTPILWWTARTHQVARHRRAVRAMTTGALVIAGAFTFPFGRLLGHWLFA